MYVCVSVHTCVYIMCLYIAFQLRVRNGPYMFSQSLIVNHLLGRGQTAQFRRKKKAKDKNKKVLLQVSKVPATFHS